MQWNQVNSPIYEWQVVASPSTIVAFTRCHAFWVLDAVTVHTGRVSCHHLQPSMNNVWTAKTREIQRTSTPVENNERSGLLYPCGLWLDLHIFQMIFKAELSFSCLTLPPIFLHPLSTTSCHYFSWIHARVHKSPICHDIWWTRQGLQESGPVWGCDLVSSLWASGSTGTEGRKGWRKGERGSMASVKGWELGAEEVGGWIHAAVWPWRQTGSPEIRGVINLSVEPVNPTAPCPGNLACSGGGRAGMSNKREGESGREMRGENMLY